MTKLPKIFSAEEVSRSMGVNKSENGQAIIKLVGKRSPKAQSAATVKRPPPVANSCMWSALLLLPSDVYLTLELCAGAVSFRLDCGQRRVYIDTFTYAAYESGRQARGGLP